MKKVSILTIIPEYYWEMKEIIAENVQLGKNQIIIKMVVKYARMEKLVKMVYVVNVPLENSQVEIKHLVSLVHQYLI